MPPPVRRYAPYVGVVLTRSATVIVFTLAGVTLAGVYFTFLFSLLVGVVGGLLLGLVADRAAVVYGRRIGWQDHVEHLRRQAEHRAELVREAREGRMARAAQEKRERGARHNAARDLPADIRTARTAYGARTVVPAGAVYPCPDRPAAHRRDEDLTPDPPAAAFGEDPAGVQLQAERKAFVERVLRTAEQDAAGDAPASGPSVDVSALDLPVSAYEQATERLSPVLLDEIVSTVADAEPAGAGLGLAQVRAGLTEQGHTVGLYELAVALKQLTDDGRLVRPFGQQAYQLSYSEARKVQAVEAVQRAPQPVEVVFSVLTDGPGDGMHVAAIADEVERRRKRPVSLTSTFAALAVLVEQGRVVSPVPSTYQVAAVDVPAGPGLRERILAAVEASPAGLDMQAIVAAVTADETSTDPLAVADTVSSATADGALLRASTGYYQVRRAGAHPRGLSTGRRDVPAEIPGQTALPITTEAGRD